MNRPLSCSDLNFNLFNGGLGCSLNEYGQYKKCITVLNEKFIETTGCCCLKILEPNLVIYMLIVPVIGIASLGALGGGIVKRPFIQAILNFDASIARDITACLMISAQIVNMVFIFLQNHPDVPERPVIIMSQQLFILQLFQLVCVQEVIQQIFYYYYHLLSFQILFFLAISPIYNILLQKNQNSNLIKESAFLTMSQQQILNQSEYSENQAKLYKYLYAEQCQRFPLVPILITLGNFSINELLLLLRSSPYHISFLMEIQIIIIVIKVLVNLGIFIWYFC